MPDVKLTPDAFGTLLAMKRVKKIRYFEPSIAKELVEAGLAREEGKALTITDAGKAARRSAKSVHRHLVSTKGRGSEKEKGHDSSL